MRVVIALLALIGTAAAAPTVEQRRREMKIGL